MIALRRQVVNLKDTYLILHRYSTAATPKASHFMADYLIKSLGFSREEAISASTKVNRLKSTQNPHLVINLFKQYGLDQTQIRTIISKAPKLLCHRVDENLESKFWAFKELGFSGSDFVVLLHKHSRIFHYGLNTHIIPTITFLRNLLGSDEIVIKAINKQMWVLAPGALKCMPENVISLQNFGFSNEKITKFVLKITRAIVLTPPNWFKDVLHIVEGELGIPRDSPNFVYGVQALASQNKSYIQMKLGTFLSFGFTDFEFYAMVKVQPTVLALSEDNICAKLNFYLYELGYTHEYIASHPILLTFSLEKRVNPRNQVLNILKENKLLNFQLLTVLAMSELKFVKRVVLRYKKEIPELFETYTNSVES